MGQANFPVFTLYSPFSLAMATETFRNFDPTEGQVLDPIAFYIPNQPQAPFFHVMGSAAACDELHLAWEPNLKRPKDEILDGSQVSSLDFFKMGRVSTGLGLSLDNVNPKSSSAFNLLPTLDDAFDREMQRMDAEMDSFIRLQGDQLRKLILEKVQAKQLQTLASLEEKFRHKMQEEELQIQDVTKRNIELEEQFRKLNYEAGMWQQQAKINEDRIAALRLKYQQVHAQNREGWGDSEVDSVSCSKMPMNFHLSCKENEKEFMACKVCGVNEMCMLLLPCRHLCLCKDCDVKLNFCPVCQSSKFLGVEVYM